MLDLQLDFSAMIYTGYIQLYHKLVKNGSVLILIPLSVFVLVRSTIVTDPFF